MDSEDALKPPVAGNDLLQPSLLTTEPTAAGGMNHLGNSAENIIGEEASLFDKGLIDINTA